MGGGTPFIFMKLKLKFYFFDYNYFNQNMNCLFEAYFGPDWPIQNTVRPVFEISHAGSPGRDRVQTRTDRFFVSVDWPLFRGEPSCDRHFRLELNFRCNTHPNSLAGSTVWTAAFPRVFSQLLERKYIERRGSCAQGSIWRLQIKFQ